MKADLYKGGRHMELTTKRRVMKKEKSGFKLLPAALMIAACFLISRVCFLDQMLPASAALITALLSVHSLNLYLLPFMLLGIAALYPSGISIWPAMGASCGCGLVFLCTGRLRFTPWQRGIIAGAITMISRSIFAIASGTAYRTGAWDLLLEGCIAGALCVIFQIFLQMVKGKEPLGGHAGGLLALCITVMCLACGAGFSGVLLTAAMILTLFLGYLLGPMEGLFAAFASGSVLMLCGSFPGAVLTLAAGGLAAGFFQNHGKVAAALCFAAALMGTGALETSINLALPYYGSLSAAAMLILIPKKWMAHLDSALSLFLKWGAYEEKKKGADAAFELEKLQKTFENLSSLFVSQNNRRILMSYQFKAMSQILEHTRAGLSPSSSAGASPRYRIKAAQAGYAKNKGISGDSCMWARLPGNRFAVVLSDGMGSGRIAAGESNLAVTTVIRLLETGLEVELVLKLLNEILLLNADKEVFSTIDLGIFNEKTGKMKFYKIGAAPTFIRRRYSVETLAVSAMPLGIVDGLKMDYVTASLNPGDQVIMASDGVTDCLRDDISCQWLKDTISKIRSRDPQTMCDLIINRAAAHYGEREKDDLTVVALRVE